MDRGVGLINCSLWSRSITQCKQALTGRCILKFLSACRRFAQVWERFNMLKPNYVWPRCCIKCVYRIPGDVSVSRPTSHQSVKKSIKSLIRRPLPVCCNDVSTRRILSAILILFFPPPSLLRICGALIAARRPHANHDCQP